MSIVLYVTNLASNTSELELRGLFTNVGQIRSLRLHTDPRSLAGNRYSVVEMETSEMSHSAMEHLNQHLLHERRIKVVALNELTNQASVNPQDELSMSRRNELRRVK